jgi:hypothetical protein
MKAVKLYKINWNLDKLTPEEKEEAKKTLPTSKGFKADDSFDVVERQLFRRLLPNVAMLAARLARCC